jgi:hypothetical protein
MADEAFALSPITARAAQPSEEDYAAIQEAFMETARGRWFLREYAKRNRNADTRLVLDAVARIEESVAAQKQAVAEADLSEALASIRSAVGEAQNSANAGLEGLALDEQLAPIAKAVRIIREISWRWRETGADGRICDILDSQVAAIEGSTGQISVAEARETVDQAFAAIAARISEYSPEAAPEHARRETGNISDANVVPFPTPAEELVAAEIETAAVAETIAEAKVAEAATVEPIESIADTAAPVASAVDAIEVVDEAAADAHDEAVLDLIAAEMSAEQPIEDDIEFIEPPIVQPPPGERGPFDSKAAPDVGMVNTMAAPAAPSQPAPSAKVVEAAPAASAPQVGQVAETQVSIGSAILASGILSKPTLSVNDPLAPIRRMSQAERIAFFS